MTLEYVLLLVVGGALFMQTLIAAPKKAFDEGGVRLAARVETQLATGSGFKAEPGGGAHNGRVPWQEEQ